MTLAASDEVPAGIIQVPDGSGVLEFNGRLVAEASTAVPGKPRWTEIRLYAVTDGTGRYVLARTGRSLVYHKAEGGCSRGVRTQAASLPAESVPCQYCKPRALAILAMLPGSSVSAETDHNGAEVCESAGDMLEKLKMPPEFSASNGIGSAYSEPALRLLDEAKNSDPAVSAALSRVRRL